MPCFLIWTSLTTPPPHPVNPPLTPHNKYQLPLPHARYQAGDTDDQEWSASSFFYAPPAPLSPPPTSRQGDDGDDGADADDRLTTTPTLPRQGDALPDDGGVSTRSRSRRHYAAKVSNSRNGDSLDGDEAVGVGDADWGPEAVKIAVFGDMGTAEIDGTLDAGHTEEPPSLQTVGILKKELGVGARQGGEGGGRDSGGVGRAPEPQLGLVMHIGDLSYARGYDAQWDEVRVAVVVFDV